MQAPSFEPLTCVENVVFDFRSDLEENSFTKYMSNIYDYKNQEQIPRTYMWECKVALPVSEMVRYTLPVIVVCAIGRLKFLSSTTAKK